MGALQTVSTASEPTTYQLDRAGKGVLGLQNRPGASWLHHVSAERSALQNAMVDFSPNSWPLGSSSRLRLQVLPEAFHCYGLLVMPQKPKATTVELSGDKRLVIHVT